MLAIEWKRGRPGQCKRRETICAWRASWCRGSSVSAGKKRRRLLSGKTLAMGDRCRAPRRRERRTFSPGLRSNTRRRGCLSPECHSHVRFARADGGTVRRVPGGVLQRCRPPEPTARAPTSLAGVAPDTPAPSPPACGSGQGSASARGWLDACRDDPSASLAHGKAGIFGSVPSSSASG